MPMPAILISLSSSMGAHHGHLRDPIGLCIVGLSMKDVNYARLVKRIRDASGMTQEQLAQTLGVTFGTINGWENGKHKPLPVLRRQIEQAADQFGIAVGVPREGRNA